MLHDDHHDWFALDEALGDGEARPAPSEMVTLFLACSPAFREDLAEPAGVRADFRVPGVVGVFGLGFAFDALLGFGEEAFFLAADLEGDVDLRFCADWAFRSTLASTTDFFLDAGVFLVGVLDLERDLGLDGVDGAEAEAFLCDFGVDFGVPWDDAGRETLLADFGVKFLSSTDFSRLISASFLPGVLAILASFGFFFGVDVRRSLDWLWTNFDDQVGGEELFEVGIAELSSASLRRKLDDDEDDTDVMRAESRSVESSQSWAASFRKSNSLNSSVKLNRSPQLRDVR